MEAINESLDIGQNVGDVPINEWIEDECRFDGWWALGEGEIKASLYGLKNTLLTIPSDVYVLPDEYYDIDCGSLPLILIGKTLSPFVEISIVLCKWPNNEGLVEKTSEILPWISTLFEALKLTEYIFDRYTVGPVTISNNLYFTISATCREG